MVLIKLLLLITINNIKSYLQRCSHSLIFPQNFVPQVSLDLNVADFGNCQNLRVIDNNKKYLVAHTSFIFFPQNFVPHVSLDLNVADFGNCQNLRVIDDKVINLTNHTKGKITVQWIVGKCKFLATLIMYALWFYMYDLHVSQFIQSK